LAELQFVVSVFLHFDVKPLG